MAERPEGPDEGLRELADAWDREADRYLAAEPVHFRALAETARQHARELRSRLPLLTAERERVAQTPNEHYWQAMARGMQQGRDYWRERAAALQRQVDEALRLHRKTGGICNYDGLSWPCATAAALSRTATEGKDRG